MDPEQYHAQYPIGSRWLLPVTVDLHYHPEADDYDPRPIRLRTEGLTYITPKTRALDLLQPTTPPPHKEEPSTISVSLTLTPTQYANLCIALLKL